MTWGQIDLQHLHFNFLHFVTALWTLRTRGDLRRGHPTAVGRLPTSSSLVLIFDLQDLSSRQWFEPESSASSLVMGKMLILATLLLLLRVSTLEWIQESSHFTGAIALFSCPSLFWNVSCNVAFVAVEACVVRSFSNDVFLSGSEADQRQLFSPPSFWRTHIRPW